MKKLLVCVPAAALLASGAIAEDSVSYAVTNTGTKAMERIVLPLPFRSTRASVSIDGGAWKNANYDPTRSGDSAFALTLAPGSVARFKVDLYANDDWQICPKCRDPQWNIVCPCCDTVAKNQALNRHYREVCRLDEAAHDAWAAVKDAAGVAAMKAKLRKGFTDAIGGFPARTPLNAKVTGVLQREGYRVEKVIFESEPQHYVTAHLFLPDGASAAAKVPAVLVSCGHSEDGKFCRKYQRISVLAAKAGMAALIFDPIDQGERWQGLSRRFCDPCAGHFAGGKRAHLIGWSEARFRIWDGIRATDYLCSRPEIDAAHLGVLGQSGGGTLSSYLFAMDDRLQAVAPAGYITTMSRLAEHWGPQDSEQTIQGQLVFGLNHLSLLAMRAPAPVCLTLVEHDAFPYDGSLVTYGKLRDLYTRLGVPERATYVHEPGTHGYFEGTMRGSIDFMRRWLKGETGPCDYGREDDFGLWSSKGAAVTPKGFVTAIPGYRSTYDIMRDELKRRDAARKPFTRADVIRLSGINPDVTDAPDDDFSYDGGRKAYWTRFLSPVHEVATVDLWLGTSYVKERAETFITRARKLQKKDPAAKLPLKVSGDDVVAAAHAKYLCPDLFGELEISDPPPSWRAGMADQDLELPMTSLVYGALPTYDWTDLLK